MSPAGDAPGRRATGPVLTGRAPALVLLGLLAVLLRPTAGTVWLWLLVVLLLLTLDLALAASPGRVTLARDDVGSVRQGDAAVSRLRVGLPHEGRRRRARGLLRDAWQPSAGASGERHRVALRPGEEAVLETTLRPSRRGDLRAAGVTVRLLGPLGLAGRQRTTSVPGTVRSVPPFRSRKHLPSRLARLRELDGRAAVRVRGQGTEFDSLREYVAGDDVRSIDWRASARSREVVVRTWQPERDRRVVLVLDTSRTSAGRIGDGTRLDATMDAALLLASLAARAGDRVDVVAGDSRVRRRLRAAGARDVAATLQDAFADLEPVLAEADWGGLAAAVSGLGRQRALLVLLTPLESSAVEESLLPVLPTLARHHRVVVASVADPGLEAVLQARDGTAAAYTAAAAEQTSAGRVRTAAVLGALGVDVVDADPEALPPALADHYLSLKARGLL